MNKKQRKLYKALEVLSTATLNLSDAVNVCDELSKEEIQEVVDKISAKYTEFNSKDLYEEAYNYDTYANNILTGITDKLDIEPEE